MKLTDISTKPYAVARSRSADQPARNMFDARPDLIEGFELIAEAVFVLVGKNMTGALTRGGRDRP
jgi:hypothetical protein